MRSNVCSWLEEIALAEVKAGLVAGPVVDSRITAMRELFSGWKDMANIAQFRETMTTAHFTHYFSDALSRAFYDDYQYKIGSWTNYTYADQVPDFRDVDRYRMTEPGTLQKRREKEEAKATFVADSVVQYGVEEYAVQFDVSWRTIMNDDLGKIKETPQRMAKAAGRWLDAWVSALYDNATTQAAMNALGLTYGGTGRLTAQNLAVGINAMMQHVDANGNQMNITKVNLVVPPILQLQAQTILQSTQLAGTPNNDINVLPQFLGGLYVDPYITTAVPNVPWYLFADPAEVPTVTVVRLAGVPGPFIYKKSSDIEMISGSAPVALLMGGFATGDIEYMVEDIIGGWDNATYVGVTDYRGLYYSAGTTA